MLSNYLTSSRSAYSNIQLNTKHEVLEFCNTLLEKVLLTFTITIDEMKCEKVPGLDENDGTPSTVAYYNMVLKERSHVKKFKSVLLTIFPNYRCTIISLHADYVYIVNTDLKSETSQVEETYCTMAPQSMSNVPAQEEESAEHPSRCNVGYETQV